MDTANDICSDTPLPYFEVKLWHSKQWKVISSSVHQLCLKNNVIFVSIGEMEFNNSESKCFVLERDQRYWGVDMNAAKTLCSYWAVSIELIQGVFPILLLQAKTLSPYMISFSSHIKWTKSTTCTLITVLQIMILIVGPDWYSYVFINQYMMSTWDFVMLFGPSGIGGFIVQTEPDHPIQT